MLPPGHIAAGYLTGYALLNIVKPDLPVDQLQQLLWWGTFFGFAPDFDNFIAFAKVKSWWYRRNVDNGIHRKFYSHVPVLWLVAGLLVYIFSGDVYWKTVGLMLWLGSWSHFILDSIEYGVMWLWPFNSEVWALKDRGIKREISANGFLQYWWSFLKYYTSRWTFYCEIFIILITFIIYFR